MQIRFDQAAGGMEKHSYRTGNKEGFHTEWGQWATTLSKMVSEYFKGTFHIDLQ